MASRRNRNRPTPPAPEPAPEPTPAPATVTQEIEADEEFAPIDMEAPREAPVVEAEPEPEPAPESTPPVLVPAKPVTITALTKAVLPWVSDDASRFALGNVLFEPDGRQVTCNGSALAILTPRGIPEPGDFPVVNGVSAAKEVGRESRMLRAAHVQRVLQMTPRPKQVKAYPVLANAWELENPSDPAAIHLAVTDMEQSMVIRIRLQEGHYPAYDKVLPTGATSAVVGLDPDYLIKVGQSMKAIEAKSVKVTVYEKAGASVRFEGTGPNGQLTVIVAPQRLS